MSNLLAKRFCWIILLAVVSTACNIRVRLITPEVPAASQGMPTPTLLHEPVSQERIVYSAEFSKDGIQRPGAVWSATSLDRTPSGRSFLGQFANDDVTLSLSNLPSHMALRVSFDLYIIRSWDGNWPGAEDFWDFSIDNYRLLHTTFDNQVQCADHWQAFPDNFPQGKDRPFSGAAEINALGYQFGRPMDAVYSLSFTVEHTASSAELRFAASELEGGMFDESWGIDNVIVVLVMDQADGF